MRRTHKFSGTLRGFVVACLLMVPGQAFAQYDYDPNAERLYCRVSKTVDLPSSGICHSYYGGLYSYGLSRSSVIVFQDEVAQAKGERPAVYINFCVLRADLSSLCAFSTEAADE